MIQNRWKSPVVWTAVAAQIINLVGLLGGWDAIGITSDAAQGVFTAVLEILTLLGILNNPTDKESW